MHSIETKPLSVDFINLRTTKSMNSNFVYYQRTRVNVRVRKDATLCVALVEHISYVLYY